MFDIPKSDPRHAAAQKVINDMHEFWKLQPMRGAVQWIEDTDGRLVVFTRGEYKQAIKDAIGPYNIQEEEFFQLTKEPTYRPYKDQQEAMEHLKGKYVAARNGNEWLVVCFQRSQVKLADLGWWGFEGLKNNFTIDGHPCGVLEDQSDE